MQLLEQIAHNEISNDVLLEAALMEASFSKKQLQDPKTVEKILNKKHVFTSVIIFVSLLITIIGAIISVGILLFPLGLIFVCIASSLSAYPKKANEKQLLKLKDQCEKLIAKMEKSIEKDPKNKSKYSEVIDNCRKTIDTIDAYYKDVSNKEKMKDIEYATELYKRLVKYIESPTSDLGPGDLDMFVVADMLGIKESDIGNAIKTNGKFEKFPFKYYGLDNLSDEQIQKYSSILPEIKTNDPLFTVYGHDDYVIVFSKKANGFLEIIASDENNKINQCSLYNTAQDLLTDNIDKKALIEADKVLGYYRLSKCPSQVKPKQFPI